jgi:peptidoglycan/xylan/chitin deacetylase (PgdA/CDA1 family)
LRGRPAGYSVLTKGRWMMSRLRPTVLHLSKRLGLFRLARRLTRNSLRILGYHGFSMADEGLFRKRLFMDPRAFRERMDYLARAKVPVLALDDALKRLDEGTLPQGATVITIDDGFYSVFKCAYPVLRELSFPFTVYVSTYYCVKGTPVFRLAVQYMFWRTDKDRVEIGGMGSSYDGELRLSDTALRDSVMWQIIRYGETELDEGGRCELCRELAGLLEVDYDRVVRSRSLSFMTSSEVRELSDNGVDIQIHSHRHRMPVDEALLKKEITENREILEGWTGKPLIHACYPDGLWDSRQFPWLEALGVRSACTCDGGLNGMGTPKLALRRALDSEIRSLVEFEAELSGYMDLMRSARARVLGRRESAGRCE